MNRFTSHYSVAICHKCELCTLVEIQDINAGYETWTGYIQTLVLDQRSTSHRDGALMNGGTQFTLNTVGFVALVPIFLLEPI